MSNDHYFNLGYDAYFALKPANPYKEDSAEYESWKRGYQSAQTAHRNGGVGCRYSKRESSK